MSLKCENIRLPEPVANTINSGEIPDWMATGSMIGAAVMVATVAEPIANRNTAATEKARISGLKEIPFATSAMYELTWLSFNTCENAPPIVTNSLIVK